MTRVGARVGNVFESVQSGIMTRMNGGRWGFMETIRTGFMTGGIYMGYNIKQVAIGELFGGLDEVKMCLGTRRRKARGEAERGNWRRRKMTWAEQIKSIVFWGYGTSLRRRWEEEERERARLEGEDTGYEGCVVGPIRAIMAGYIIAQEAEIAGLWRWIYGGGNSALRSVWDEGGPTRLRWKEWWGGGKTGVGRIAWK